MDMNYENILRQMTDFIQKEARTETVVGNPFTLGAFTCVPVVRLGVGFGSGGGSGDAPGKNAKGEGGGGGAGIGIDPIGFLVVREDQISFVSTHRDKGLAAVFERVPELLKKAFVKKEEHRTKE